MHFHGNLFKAKGEGCVCVWGGCGKICQIMHNCSTVALVSTSRAVPRGH